MKDTLLQLLDKPNNKNEIINELKVIYENLIDKVEQSEIVSLKSENNKLRQHIKNIDHKFDHIIKENRELKEYIKSKTEDYENNLHTIIIKIHDELKLLNDQNSNTINSTIKRPYNNKIIHSNIGKNTEKTSTQYQDSPISNNDYSENVLQTEGTNSIRNNININYDDFRDDDIISSSKIIRTSNNGNDLYDNVK